MSEGKAKTALSDLRQFRLQKPKLSTVNGQENSEGSTLTEQPVVRKRIKIMDDTDSDNETEPQANSAVKKSKIEFSIEEKERRFIAASKLASEYDSMDVQDALLRSDWDVSTAIRHLKEKCKPKVLNSRDSRDNGKSSTLSRRRSYESEDDDHHQAKHEQVYDSDESDTESSNRMTSQRKAVYEFLNNATLYELLSIQGCSERKVNVIIELRPFSNWRDLKEKFENHKLLSADILNNCQDYINKQNNVANIMAQCNKMVKKIEAAIKTGAGITKQPKILNPNLQLAEYQIIGLNWLAVMHKEKMNGILADEMGLGKTIQVIAFLAYLKEQNLVRGCHLIVVPSSTLDNWEVELMNWCPSFNIEKYYGSQEERKSLRIKYAKQGFLGIDILLTTYHMVSLTPEERKMFKVSKMHYVIFDEAHMLKNMNSQRYAQLIHINAEMRILLTGTPLQNNLLELMSLLCFLMPSIFAKKIDDLKSLFQKKGKKENDESSSFEKTQIEHAKRIMKPFVLRRLKADVLMYLPNKIDLVKKIPMSERQKDFYSNLVQYYSNEKVNRGSTEIAGASMMMDMRKLANHPLLMRYFFTDDDIHEISKRLSKSSNYKKNNPQHIFEELACLSDFQVWQTCDKYELDDVTIPKSLILDSGKFKELDNLLPKLKEEGHRVLIFSQFTMMLDILERYLEIRRHTFVRLDGQTVVTERQELIDRFNRESDIFVFLLSTKAGGMGINLTAADTAIIHDIDFNPYNDKQAEDRCHRMGQTKTVTIYRLISEGTIEEGMLFVAKDKLELEKEIHSEKGNVQEHKCMVRLLTMALGLDEKRAESLMAIKDDKNNLKDELEEF